MITITVAMFYLFQTTLARAYNRILYHANNFKRKGIQITII